MKKVFILAIGALLAMGLSGCLSRGAQKKAANETVVMPETATVTPEHNARNSLDFEGTYQTDQLPGESGPMSVTITLSGDFFMRVTGLAEETKKFVESGNFSWNDAGNIITLIDAQVPNQYFVAEGRLIQLDSEGNRITGENAHLYSIPQIASGDTQ